MNWIEFVKEHHHAVSVIDEDTIKISEIGFDKDGNTFDDVIQHLNGIYIVQEFNHKTGKLVSSWHVNTIKEYLGY